MNALTTITQAVRDLQQNGFEVMSIVAASNIPAIDGITPVIKPSYRKMVSHGKDIVKSAGWKANTDENGISSGHILSVRHDGQGVAVLVLQQPIEKKSLTKMSALQLIPAHLTEGRKKASIEKDELQEA